MIKVWSWRQAVIKSDLESPTKLLLLTMSVYMSDAGQSCFPSITQLEKDTGLNRATIVRHTIKAVEKGFLTKRVNKASGNEWARNEYTAIYPEGVVAQNNYPVVAESDGGSCTQQLGVVAESDTNSPVINSPVELKSLKARKLSKKYSDDFESWWLQYPNQRRRNKPDACKAYQVARQDTTPEKLMDSLIAYCQTDEVSRGFAPYPAKWLRQEKYNEDFIETGAQIYDNNGSRVFNKPQAANGYDVTRFARVAASLIDKSRRLTPERSLDGGDNAGMDSGPGTG